MKALTVHQPWAWAIVHGGKTIENRSTLWRYRGPLAIHAGQSYSDDGGRSRLILQHEDYADAELHKGSIIGVVDLVDAHWCEVRQPGVMVVDCCQPWGEHKYVDVETRRLCDPVVNTIRQPQVVHLVLENPRPLPVPIPARGMQGMWDPDLEVLEQINHQIGA